VFYDTLLRDGDTEVSAWPSTRHQKLEIARVLDDFSVVAHSIGLSLPGHPPKLREAFFAASLARTLD